RGRLFGAGDMAEADAGTLDDPLVRGVDLLRQFVVRHPPGWKRRARAGDDRTNHAAASKFRRSSAIRRVRSARTILAALPIAVATPSSLALPWLFTTSPFRPRKTAPLWLLGSRWWRSSSAAGREIRNPIFERTERVKARRRRSVTKRAVPSSDLSAILPEKPSVTITSTAPRD